MCSRSWARRIGTEGWRLMNTFVHRVQLRLLLVGLLAGRAPNVRRLRLVLKI